MKAKGKIQIALLISTFIVMIISPLNCDQVSGISCQGSGVRGQVSGVRFEDIELTICNIKFQEIRKYSIANIQYSINEDQYSITWDGLDKDKSSVSSGMYSYKLKMGSERSDAKKMLLLR